MAKKEKGSELEYLRGLAREQKAIIKNLRKAVSRQNKKSHQYEDLEEKIQELDSKVENKTTIRTKDSCPECSESLITVDIGIRKLVKCSSCPYRKSIK